MKIIVALIFTCAFQNCLFASRVSKKEPEKLDYKISGADISIKLPNDSWYLSNKPNRNGTISYIFKRKELLDSHKKKVVPAIIVQYAAIQYEGNAAQYMTDNIGSFVKNGMKIKNIFNLTDKDYPLSYKNASVIKGSYNQDGVIHIIYLIYIVNKKGFVVQVNMDMTDSISNKCEPEFLMAMKSIQ